MKKFFATLLMVVLLSGCTSRSLVEGSEAIYYGTVTDRAMSSTSYDKYGRPYINILTDVGESMGFWSTKKDNHIPNEVHVGDYVKIESAIEDESGHLIVVSITKLNCEIT